MLTGYIHQSAARWKSSPSTFLDALLEFSHHHLLVAVLVNCCWCLRLLSVVIRTDFLLADCWRRKREDLAVSGAPAGYVRNTRVCIDFSKLNFDSGSASQSLEWHGINSTCFFIACQRWRHRRPQSKFITVSVVYLVSVGRLFVFLVFQFSCLLLACR